MKVYVDFEELDVEDKPTYICNKYNLQVKSINSGSIYENVKLISLADYTKQVRKEVIDEIKENLLKLEPNCIKQPNLYDFNCQEIIDILDQIQGDKVE